jgi:superfamily II DNA/RNA helicase
MGFNPIVLNGDTWGRKHIQQVITRFHVCFYRLIRDAIQRLKDHQFDIIIAGPEMCLDERTFRPILSHPDFNEDIVLTVVDESHLIVQWGRKFRPSWAQIGTICSLLPLSAARLALSATLDPDMRERVRKSLCISSTDAFHLNLGNDRRNISQLVIRMKRSEDIRARVATLLKGLQPGSTGKMARAIVFCETRDDAQKTSQYLRRRIPDERASSRDLVEYIHAGRTKRGRATVMKRFCGGNIDILCATECVGLGQDIPDVPTVILTRLPRDLCTLLQRMGRSGRNGQAAQAYILAEASAFERYTRKKPRKPAASKRSKRSTAKAQTLADIQLTVEASELPPEDSERIPGDDDGFRKKLDPDLRAYLEVSDAGCRCAYLNSKYDNPAPPTNTGPRPVLCCDLCIKRTIPGALEMDRDELLVHMLNKLDAHSPLSTHPDSLKTTNADIKTVTLRKPKEEKIVVAAADARNKNHVTRLTQRLERLRLRLYCDPEFGYGNCGTQTYFALADIY